jgi:hypothetical protein
MVGAVAGDAECYTTFGEFFEPLVAARHYGAPSHGPCCHFPSPCSRLYGEIL